MVRVIYLYHCIVTHIPGSGIAVISRSHLHAPLYVIKYKISLRECHNDEVAFQPARYNSCWCHTHDSPIAPGIYTS